MSQKQIDDKCIMTECPSQDQEEEEFPEITDSLRFRVFHTAKDGMAITLYDLLSNLSDKAANHLLTQVRAMKVLLQTGTAVAKSALPLSLSLAVNRL